MQLLVHKVNKYYWLRVL